MKHDTTHEKAKDKTGEGNRFLRGTGARRLAKYISRETNIRARDRLIACRMYKEGTRIRDIAARTHRNYSAIRAWLTRVSENGLGDRYDAYRGAPCRLDEGQREQLVSDIEAGPEKCGFDTALWTSKTVRIHIRRRFGVDYSIRGVQDLLPRIGLSWKKARPRHPKSASKTAQKAFKKKPGGRYAGTPR